MYKLTTPLVISNIASQLKILTQTICTSKEVNIDLSKLPDIDSAGIAMLLELKHIAKIQKCNLIISNPTSFILRLCDLYKINI